MSSHVWNPRFVYRNVVTLSDGSVLASDEVTGMEDDLLQNRQPQKVWRADTLSSLTVAVTRTAAAPFQFDTAWLGYTNLTPKRNLLKRSHTLGNAAWVTDDVATVTINNGFSLCREAVGAWTITANGAGTTTHGLAQTWTPTLVLDTAESYIAVFHVNSSEAGTPSDGAEFAISADGTKDLTVSIDFSDGSLGAVTEGTGWSGGTATVETITIATVTSYRVVLTGVQSAAPTTVVARARLEMSGSTSFSQAGETMYLGNIFMDVAGTESPEAPTTTEKAAGLEIVSSGAATLSKYFPAVARDLTDNKADRGFVHGVAYVSSSVLLSSSVTFKISDEDNADAYVQAGVAVVGKAWHPQAAKTGGSQSHEGYMARLTRAFEEGRSTFNLDLDFLTEDAVRDLRDMETYCNPAGSAKTSTYAEGGQAYRRGARPALFLADDAAVSYEPERVIYGYVNVRDIRSGSAGLSSATVEIEELLP